MTDNNDNKRTVEEIIAAAIEKKRSQQPPRSITPEQLKAMVADRQRAKRRRALRTAGFAAIFVIAVISTALIFNSITVDVGADKNAKEEIRTENGVVIEDGGWGSSSEDCVVITEWDEIEEVKVTNEKLILLEYIPISYEFKSLTIEHVETGNVTNEYILVNTTTNEIIEVEEFVQDKGITYFEIDNVSRKINCTKGTIYIQEDENKIATIQMDDGIYIRIWSVLSDKELVEIVEGITY